MQFSSGETVRVKETTVPKNNRKEFEAVLGRTGTVIQVYGRCPSLPVYVVRFSDGKCPETARLTGNALEHVTEP